jgi:hypothetical protein
VKHRFLNQLLGEVNRLRKQPGPAILGIVWIVLLLTLYLLDAYWQWGDYGNTKNFKSLFSFPLNLRHWSQLLSVFSAYLSVLLVALDLGGDFQLSILKMSLPKFRKRFEYLGVKIAAITVYLIVLNSISCLLALLSGLVGSFVTHQPIRLSGGLTLVELFGLIIVSTFLMLLYGVVTGLAILLTRSPIAGLLAGVFFLPFVNLFGKISPSAAWLTPLHHINNIEVRLVYLGQLNSFLEKYGDHNWLTSTLFLTMFIGIAFYGAFKRFQRMDFDTN